MTKAIKPIMPEGGSIVNISSQAARDGGGPGSSLYSASKGALERMAEALRMETQSFGIRICNLAPGDFISNIAERRHNVFLNKDSPYWTEKKLLIRYDR